LKFGTTRDIKIRYRNALMRNFQGYFSRTFHDLKLQFPELSRTKVIFQDFPGPGILQKKNPGLSRRRGNPVNSAFKNPAHQISSKFQGFLGEIPGKNWAIFSLCTKHSLSLISVAWN